MKKSKIIPILFTQILYYILVLSLPIAAGTVVQYRIVQIMKEKTDEAYCNNLTQAKDRVDKILSDVNYISQVLISNNSLQSLAYCDSSTIHNPYYYYNISKLQEIMSSFILSNGFISDIKICLNNSQYYLTNSTCYSYETASSAFYLKKNLGSELFQSFTVRNEANRIMITPEEAPSSLYFLTGNAHNTSRSISILITLDTKAIMELLKSENSEIYLISDKQRLLTEDNTGNLDILALADLIDQGPFGIYQLDASYVLTETSDYKGVNYISVIPQEVYLENINYIKLIFLIYCIVCLILGSIISILLAQRSYNPIKKILSIIKEANLSSELQNEYKKIETTLLELISSRKSYSKNLNNYKHIMANHILNQTVKGRLPNYSVFEEKFLSLGMTIVYDAYLLIGFDIEDASNLFFEPQSKGVNEEMFDTIYFILRNIASELFSSNFTNYIGEVDNRVICIINLESDIDAKKLEQGLEKQIKELQSFMKVKFGVIISSNISNIYKDYNNIPGCYTEIKEMINYRNLIGTKKDILYYEDIIRQEAPNDSYARELEGEAIRYIQSHNYSCAAALLNRISASRIDELPESSLSPGSYRSLEELVKSINNFIEDNYTDPNFSAGQISEHFKISSSYLSQIYKKIEGSGVLDYIHYLRVEKAKELLMQDITVQKTAERVGYYNTRPMVEAFKRIENMTPTDYKRKFLHNAEAL